MRESTETIARPRIHIDHCPGLAYDDSQHSAARCSRAAAQAMTRRNWVVTDVSAYRGFRKAFDGV